MFEFTEEEKIKGGIEAITLEKIEKISEQMKTCICQIYGNIIGTGFFCKILYDNEYIPVLMTNYHIINDQFLQNNKNIKISINNKKIIEEININEIKIIYSSPINKYDIMILKLKENNKYNYLELDPDLYNENSEDLYEDKSIYILHFPNEDNVSVSFGYGIKNVKKSNDEYYIKHLCYIKESSSGSPILNLSTNKVIGIHIESTLNSENIKANKGILLKFPLNEMKNEIKLKVKINKEDINKKIYFLDNTKEHKFLKELDNTKIELYINDQIDEYKKYFIPKKEGIYSIKIKFNGSIKDCSNMFANCNNLISIDLSSFNTDKIINMHGMISNCLNLKDIVLSPLYIKKKNLFADKNNEILIKIYKNISSENKEKILSLILNGFNQKIKIQSNGKNKKKDKLNAKFKNLCKNLIEPILFNPEINLNLISIIDIYFCSSNISSKFLSKFNNDNSLLNLENIQIYILILEKLIDIYKEKKLDIILYLKDILKEDLDEENKYIKIYILGLFYKLSKKNKYILKALIKEDIINILLNHLNNDNKEIKNIIYDLLSIIFRNITYYNNNIFDLNEEEKEGDIYLNTKIDTKKISKEKIIPLILEEKPELFQIILIIINTGNNYNKDFLKEIIDNLFEKYKDNHEKITFLINIISSLILINDENNLDRYKTFMGYPNLCVIPIPKENKENQKWPLFGERLMNGDINQEIYEYIIDDLNKKNRCLLSILFPSKFDLDKKINIKEEQKKEILLSFIKCIYNKNNYCLFKYLYTMPSRSLKYKNLYEEIISYSDIYNMINPYINIEEMKNKEIKLKLQVEKEKNNNIKKAIEKDKDKSKDNECDEYIFNKYAKYTYNIDDSDDKDIIFKYEDKNMKYFNGFIGEIIPGEIVREVIYGITKRENNYGMYRIHYFTKYYKLDELRAKILNQSKNYHIKEEKNYEVEENYDEEKENYEEENKMEIPNNAKKYDISEKLENSIIYNIYEDEIDNFIIEDKTVNDKSNVKNTLIRFIFTNNTDESKNFNARIKTQIKKNEVKLNSFYPELIKSYIEKNNIRAFLNIQRLSDDLDFLMNDDIIIHINYEK